MASLPTSRTASPQLGQVVGAGRAPVTRAVAVRDGFHGVFGSRTEVEITIGNLSAETVGDITE